MGYIETNDRMETKFRESSQPGMFVKKCCAKLLQQQVTEVLRPKRLSIMLKNLSKK